MLKFPYGTQDYIVPEYVAHDFDCWNLYPKTLVSVMLAMLYFSVIYAGHQPTLTYLHLARWMRLSTSGIYGTLTLGHCLVLFIYSFMFYEGWVPWTDYLLTGYSERMISLCCYYTFMLCEFINSAQRIIASSNSTESLIKIRTLLSHWILFWVVAAVSLLLVWVTPGVNGVGESIASLNYSLSRCCERNAECLLCTITGYFHFSLTDYRKYSAI